MSRCWIAAALLVGLTACATLPTVQPPPERRVATLPLPRCHAGMDAPGYWLAAQRHPDQRWLSPDHVERLNRDIVERGLLTDIFSDRLWDYPYQETDRPDEVNPGGGWDSRESTRIAPGIVQGYTLYTFLKDETERIKRVTRWDQQGQPVSAQALAVLDHNLNLESIRENNHLRYGITRRRTNVRYFPTMMIMTGRPGDVDFDILQVSSVRPLEPVAVLHVSRDQAWLFVVTAHCRGWVQRADVVENCSPLELKKFINPPQRLVVIGPGVNAVGSPGDTVTAEQLPLGTACPLFAHRDGYYGIWLPNQGPEGQWQPSQAWVPEGPDLCEGFQPCTPRTVLETAFKLLHTPYSWGGRDGTWDCSQMVMDVFATMGLRLPRNSSSQAMVGRRDEPMGRHTPVETKRKRLAQLTVPALLQFPGHIMLYLGCDQGEPYALHDIWAYRLPRTDEELDGADPKVIIGQVVVSDLSLGEGSSKGSLLERLTTINRLVP